MITQDRLHELFTYNPKSGEFRHRVTRGPCKAGQLAGCPNTYGYLVIRIDYKLYQAAQLAWLYVHGVLPRRVDHKNEIRLDNRIANLRPCTHSQNIINKRGLWKNNTSGETGVYRHSQADKYEARIGKRYLGLFPTFAEALAARHKAEIETFGEFSPHS